MIGDEECDRELTRLYEENETLRIERDDNFRDFNKAVYEAERLRERGDWAVEQLRLAEAAGEELREQLSLNRIHDRDCAAREAELTRLREENERLRETLEECRQILADTRNREGETEDRLRRIEEAMKEIDALRGEPGSFAEIARKVWPIARAVLADQPTEEEA